MTTIRSLSPIYSTAGLKGALDRAARNAGGAGGAGGAAGTTTGSGAGGAGASVGPVPSTANQAASEQNLAATRVSIDLTIDSLAARQLDRAVSVQGQRSAPGPGSRSLAADPKLAQGVEALLAFLREIDPKGARRLQEMLGKIAGGDTAQPADGASAAFAPQVSASVAPSAPSAPVDEGAAREASVRGESINLAIEATLTELQTKVDGGATVSAREVEITFKARFEEILAIKRSDPLVLDLDGSGTFETTTAQAGHQFDLLGTGKPVRAATVAGGDAFLAWDRNGNGNIDGGKELFGDQYGAPDGFGELAKVDGNQDGVIDTQDSVFGSLLAFQDKNRDGQTDLGELKRLADLGIGGIRLESRAANEDSSGNKVSRVGSFLRADGTEGRIGNLLLNYLA